MSKPEHIIENVLYSINKIIELGLDLKNFTSCISAQNILDCLFL